MERSNIQSSLTDKELIAKAYWWIDELIKSGGKDFVMHVPAELNHDTDLVLFNTVKRFENLLEKYVILQADNDRLKATLSTYHGLAVKAELMEEVLTSILDGAIPRNKWEMESWIQSARKLCIEALENQEGEKQPADGEYLAWEQENWQLTTEQIAERKEGIEWIRNPDKERYDKLVDILDEARLQVEYLHKKYGETGSGNNILARISAVIDTPKMPDLTDIEYRGPTFHCKACEDERNGVKHLIAQKHICRKK